MTADDSAGKAAYPADHPEILTGRCGVLIVNLGTPDAPTPPAVRRYLAEFLSDRRVIELPRLLWAPVLHGVILNTRPRKTARLYASIWDRETGESPLRRHTRTQAEKLQQALDPQSNEIIVDWAMRYGKPSIADRIASLASRGCDRIAVIALYPQYSATTSATVYDAAFDALKRMRWQPALRTAAPYHDDPVYIEAIAADLEAHLAKLDWKPEVVLASFHGLPQKYFDQGDPYHCHCAKTVRLLRARLGLDEGALRLTFQSRFGPQAWLRPYTDETLASLAREGVRRVAVATPGFAADCLETLEEIAIANRDLFLEAGGEHYAAIPCLNAGEHGMRVIEHIARRELAGWIN
ncbi:MAG: ferrochelatase [Parvularculaceae bacterium]